MPAFVLVPRENLTRPEIQRQLERNGLRDYELKHLPRLNAWILLAPEGEVFLAQALKGFREGVGGVLPDATINWFGSESETPVGGGGGNVDGAPAAWDEVDPYHIARVTPNGCDNGGRGVCVAVLDSAVAEHADLAPGERKVERVVLVSNPSAAGNRRHGTRVAGLIGGASAICSSTDSSAQPTGRYGVAPNVDLLLIHVAASNSGIAILTEALERAIEHGCCIANLSLAMHDLSEVDRQIFDEIIRRCIGQHLVLIVAAGNYEQMTYPATNTDVISVGAVKRGDDPRYDSPAFPPSAREVDLVAPGDDLPSASVPISPSTCYHEIFAQTSAAAAVVSGVGALYASNYALRGAALRSMILDTTDATVVTEARRGRVGRGVVQYRSLPQVQAISSPHSGGSSMTTTIVTTTVVNNGTTTTTTTTTTTADAMGAVPNRFRGADLSDDQFLVQSFRALCIALVDEAFRDVTKPVGPGVKVYEFHSVLRTHEDPGIPESLAAIADAINALLGGVGYTPELQSRFKSLFDKDRALLLRRLFVETTFHKIRPYDSPRLLGTDPQGW